MRLGSPPCLFEILVAHFHLNGCEFVIGPANPQIEPVWLDDRFSINRWSSTSTDVAVERESSEAAGSRGFKEPREPV